MVLRALVGSRQGDQRRQSTQSRPVYLAAHLAYARPDFHAGEDLPGSWRVAGRARDEGSYAETGNGRPGGAEAHSALHHGQAYTADDQADQRRFPALRRELKG